MVVVGKTAEFDETLLHGHPGDRDCRRIALSENGANGAETFVAQERRGSETENVVEGAMQTSPRNVEMRADFRDMNGPDAGRVEIILDIPNQSPCRGKRSIGVGRE